MKRDLIFVFFGGTMSGVFGAGVTATLQDLNLYNRIHSVYGTSVGAHNAAYFLAKGKKTGLKIYYEEVIEDKFIKKNKFKFIHKLLLSLLIKKIKLEKLIDIDYLIDIEKNKHKLDIKEIYNSKINYFVRCFNVNSKKIEYLDGKKQVFKKLQATSAISPFYPKLIKIKNNKYSDGSVLFKYMDPLLEKMIINNPDKKIFFVFNNPKKNMISLKAIVGTFLWTIALWIYFKKKFVFNKLKIFSDYKRLKKYCQYSNVKVIEPDFSFFPICTNKNELNKLYLHGIEKTKAMFKDKNNKI